MVPCGKCEACLVSKGLQRVNDINLSLNEYKYKYFVTLTYRDECLPIACPDETQGCFLHPHDCDYNGEIKHLDFEKVQDLQQSDFDYFNKYMEKYGGLPVLSHSDAINFKKRLRHEIELRVDSSEERKFYYYLVGEYGENFYRPHYHIVFGFNSERLNAVFRECVCGAWQMRARYSTTFDSRLVGKIDIQRIVGTGCPTYVAQYLSVSAHLPIFISRGVFRQFAQHSNTSNERLFQSNCTDVKRVFSELPIYESYVDKKSGKFLSVQCSSAYKNRYFPKFYRFDTFPVYVRTELCRYVDKFEKETTAFEFAQFCYNHINTDFPFNAPPLVAYQILSQYFVLNDFAACESRLKNLFYACKKINSLTSLLGITLSEYFSIHDKFYYKIEQDKLKRFYIMVEKLMNDSYNPLSLSNLASLYNNTSWDEVLYNIYMPQFGSKGDIKQVYHFKDFAFKMHKAIVDNCKTRKRNDYFATNGLTRKPWLPMLSKNKLKLLQL